MGSSDLTTPCCLYHFFLCCKNDFPTVTRMLHIYQQNVSEATGSLLVFFYSLFFLGGGQDTRYYNLCCCGCCSVAKSCLTLCDPMECSTQASLVFTISWSLLKLMSIEWMMPSSHLILCHSLLLLPSIFPSIRIFSSESALCIRWPRDWTFTFSISPSNDYSGLLSFRIDWFDLLAVQGTLKSFLQHHSLKASFLQCSAFFMVQLSHLYMTTGETIALTRWAFVMMSLLCCT